MTSATSVPAVLKKAAAIYEEIFDSGMVIEWAKECKLAKPCIAAVGEQEFLDRWRAALTSDDQYLQTECIAGLCKAWRFNRLGVIVSERRARRKEQERLEQERKQWEQRQATWAQAHKGSSSGGGQ